MLRIGALKALAPNCFSPQLLTHQSTLIPYRLLAQSATRDGGPSVFKKLGTGVKLVLGTAGVVTVASFLRAEEIKMWLLIPTRLLRDVHTAVSIVYDYKTSLAGLEDGPEKDEATKQCHQRGADRLLQLCFANGGIYTKLGQHVGQLDHLLPEEYVLTMRNNLLDRCPVSCLKEVRRIITADLGAPPEKLFKHFNPNPIASASLAQVHVAEDHEGRKLAVKVQHAGLRESCAADVATVQFLVQAVKWIFPDFDYQWLVDEIKHNLPRELDFTHEAANAERCRANLESKRSKLRGRVYIPEMYADKTSPRVLTMEFIEGYNVTDLGALRRLAVSPASLSRLISETFNEMIFIHGDVHADPHAANLLVRKKGHQAQLVLLDHGLYRQIDDAFRLEYAALWRALVFGDVEGIEKSSTAMHAGDMVPLFAGMLTQRPWEEVTRTSDLDHLRVPNSVENRRMIQEYAQQYAREISLMLLKVPRELLLLLKTNDCLRSVDNNLGQPANNFMVTARECTRALAEARLSSPGMSGLSRLVAQARIRWEVMRLEARLVALQVLMWVGKVQAALGMAPPPRQTLLSS